METLITIYGRGWAEVLGGEDNLELSGVKGIRHSLVAEGGGGWININ